LAYSLYEIATTKRNDAKEGTAYNGLIAAWSDISAVAASLTDEDFAGDRQIGIDLRERKIMAKTARQFVSDGLETDTGCLVTMGGNAPIGQSYRPLADAGS
jgi:hypothetical protein